MPIHSKSPTPNIMIGDSGSGKTNALLNLINNQPEKDLYEAKKQYLIIKSEKVGFKHYYHPKAFIEYSNDIKDV